MFSQFLPQDENSKVSKISFAPLNYYLTDVPSAYQTGSLSRPPSVPVLGRKLSSESILTVKDESVSKYPFHVDVSVKKTTKNQSQGKTKLNVQKFKPKLEKFHKKIRVNSASANVSPVPGCSNIKIMKPAQAFSTSRKNSPVKVEKTPEKKRPVKEIREIVEKSLKKEKKIKKIKEKNEKLKLEAKERLKREMKVLNKCTREENLKNFKQKLFNPRHPWGSDEKRTQRSVEKKKELEQPLEVLNQASKRTIFSKRSKNHTPELSPAKRPQSTRPEIKDFIRKQKVHRKKSREKEVKGKLEKENKRISQLKQIDLFSKKTVQKKKPKKKIQPKPVLKKCPEFKWLDRYLESLSEFSHEGNNRSKRSELVNENKQVLGFGVVDNFEFFNTHQNEVDKKKELEGFKERPVEQLARYDVNDSSEFILEENSKILRLKKKKIEKEEKLRNEKKLDSEGIDEKKLEKKSEQFENKGKNIENEEKKEEKKEEKFLNIRQKVENKGQNKEKGLILDKKVNKDGIISSEEVRKNDEKSGKAEQFKIEKYLFQIFRSKIQALSRGWIARNEIRTKSQEQSSEESFEKSYSWIFKKLHPSDSDSDSVSFEEENEEFGKILKVFNIKSDKIKSIEEKSQDLHQNSIITNKNLKNTSEETGEFKLQNKKSLKSPINPASTPENPKNSKPLSLDSQPSQRIIQLSPIPKGHNLNLSEISIRLIQEQQNLNFLEEESKDLQDLKSPPSYQKTSLNLSPEYSSEEEIMKLFHEIIQKKYSNLDNIFEKNIQAIKDALAESINSKSKSESLELKKKLERISTDDNGEDLDQLLKDLIGTQDILNIEAEVLQDYLNSFPGSRNSPIPNETPFKYPESNLNPNEYMDLPFFPQKNLEDLLSQRSTPIEGPLSPSNYFLTKLEPNLLADLILQNLDEYLIDLTESLISGLLENEIILINEEFHQAMSEENLCMFTQEVFIKFGSDILKELNQNRNENPLEILAMMQESEIGSGTFNDDLEAVIDPRIFLEVINEDPLQVCIYKKMIFDCINEFLNRFVFKVPWPWSFECRMNKKVDEVEGICEGVKLKIFKCNEFKIGKIFGFVSEGTEAVIKAREERILKALDFDCKEEEVKWVNYLFEEDQAKLDIADMLLEELVDETIYII